MDAAETREYAKDRANIYPSMNGATSFHPGPGNLKAPSLLPDGQVLHAPNDQKSEESSEETKEENKDSKSKKDKSDAEEGEVIN